MANHCATDLGFLSFVCESMVMAVKEIGNKNSSLRVMINFYLKTLCSAILHSLSQKKKKKKKKMSNDENFVAHLMPFLLKGLKSKCVDYKRANYLILSHLSNIFTFQTNVKDEILNVMSKVKRTNRFDWINNDDEHFFFSSGFRR
jgi:U3 small nucleolar RNA-associated protein 10